MNIFTEKLKTVLTSLLPVIVVVLLLNFTFISIEKVLLYRFIIGSILIILGLTIFLIGVDIGVIPLGGMVGSTIAKSNKLGVVITAGLILGFLISIAEPGLIVLANQISTVTGGQLSSTLLIVVVSVGLSLMLAIGFLRIIYAVPLYLILLLLYGITFVLSFFVSMEFLAISFDASGATTGVMAVPFILALAIGISKLKKDSKASEKDSFGLVAITSVGAILAVMIMGIATNTQVVSGEAELSSSIQGGVIQAFLNVMPSSLRESSIAIVPLLIVLVVIQQAYLHLHTKKYHKLLKGFLYAFTGLLLFLIGVNAGFMEVGELVGKELALLDNKVYLIVIAFILGVTTILAEPAVYVLTHQIEEVTSGYVKRSAVLISLSIGVGIAVALSATRILVPSIQLWHYLLPGYIISLALMFTVPKLFVGMAFDAGGVATGPMTATFILAFIHGAADAVDGADVIIDGFGMIATVAMMPIIALQILGVLFQINTKGRGRSA